MEMQIMDLAKTKNRSALRLKGTMLELKGRMTHRKRTQARGRAMQLSSKARKSAGHLGHRLRVAAHR
jgi:uncharacterized protein YjbJ (UPF0337 family)